MSGGARAHGTTTVSSEQLHGLEWRCIGPHKGGRVVAVAGHPIEDQVFYFGACAGGVWKTNDAGQYWENISDGFFTTAAVGALAVSESDPNVLYVGTGEHTIRGNVSHGDGVYKSTDGGKTWINLGLQDTRHISRIRIHPQNPDVVYVAALGHAWGPNEDRGVFRSRDGGATWDKVLYKSDHAGAIDLSLDERNPRILYAALWEGGRTPFSLNSGGPDSGLYRSTDGGDTWTDISRNAGLPKGVLGKIGVAASPARSGRVWALIEAEDGALFRSDNGGETWQRINETPELRRRAWYYMHVFADPRNADTVWVLNLQAWKSIDGGATMTPMATPHGDNHDLWIDPKNPLRMIEGNDGGACVSFNGGHSWSSIYNQPTAQFYHVETDTRVPYRVYGSQQDNTAISLPSLSSRGVITQTEWFTPGGGESGYIAVRPDNPDIVFGGAIGSGFGNGRLTRYDHSTGQIRLITVWPDVNVMYEGAEALKYRFQWTFPIFISPHDPNVLYTAGNRLFRSTNEGSSWEPISPDLTRAEPHTLVPSGGPITRDNTGAEVYATIFACVESPHQQGLFWVGTDDGLVHLSRDGGQTWKNITPPDLPEWSLISILEPSPHDPATAYLAATRYKLDDTRPYLFKTNDYGATWTAITQGIPENDFTRVIREDPECRGLLYAGTETGIYVSFDDGASWQPLQTNLPVCPIHDLVIKNHDLIAATHGRSFWILDDVTPLHQIKNEAPAGPRLFRPEDTIRFKIYEGFGSREGETVLYSMAGPIGYGFKQVEKPDGTKEQKLLDAGKNRPNGVLVSYYLPEAPDGEITLTFRDSEGKELRSFSSQKPETDDGNDGAVALQEEAEGMEVMVDPEADEEQQDQFIPAALGLNRFAWNFRCANGTKILNDKFSETATAGPQVPPGRYRVDLKVGEDVLTQEFEIRPDPRIDATDEDLRKQFDLAMLINKKLSEAHEAVNRIRDVREQIEGWETRIRRHTRNPNTLRSAASLKKKLTAIEEELTNTKATGPRPAPPPNVPTRLNLKLVALANYVESADFAPTQQEYEVFNELADKVNTQISWLDTAIATDLPSFLQAVRDEDIPSVLPR